MPSHPTASAVQLRQSPAARGVVPVCEHTACGRGEPITPSPKQTHGGHRHSTATATCSRSRDNQRHLDRLFRINGKRLKVHTHTALVGCVECQQPCTLGRSGQHCEKGEVPVLQFRGRLILDKPRIITIPL